MLVLRVLAIFVLITLAVSFGVYLLSGDKRYLRFSWQVIKFSLVLALVFMVVVAVGRIILFWCDNAAFKLISPIETQANSAYPSARG